MRVKESISVEEKRRYCDLMTASLVELRGRLGRTQEEMETVSGISRVTLSQIESRRSQMNWLHFGALMQLFTQSQETKELLFVRGILDEQLLRRCQPLAAAAEFNVDIPEDQIRILHELHFPSVPEEEGD